MNDIPTTPLFVKIRGRIHGPFDDEKLKSMVRRGQLSRIHMVSPDGETWQKATDFPQLFERSGVESSPTATMFDTSSTADRPGQRSSGTSQAPTSVSWYYGENDQQVGPVPQEQLIELIRNGRLTADSLVWCQGMGNWKTVAEIAELRGYLPAGIVAVGHDTAGKQAEAGDDKSSLPAELFWLTKSLYPWVLFIAVTGYIITSLLVSLGFMLLTGGVPVVVPGVLALTLAAGLVTGAILLNLYANALRRTYTLRNTRNFVRSQRRLNRFWVFSGMALIVLLIFLIVGLITFYSQIGALFQSHFRESQTSRVWDSKVARDINPRYLLQ